MSEPTQAQKSAAMARQHGLHGTSALIEAQADELKRLRAENERLRAFVKREWPGFCVDEALSHSETAALQHKGDGDD